MLRKISHRKRSATLVLLFFVGLLGVAWTQTESVLYNFCTQTNCTDGASPVAGLIFDQKQNLYGTTFNGGPFHCDGTGCGVVFKLSPKGKETVLHNFCAQSGCTDGEFPKAGLIFDRKGNLYGTTSSGGVYGRGNVFKLTPDGRVAVLYSFCAQNKCTDGEYPYAGVVLDQAGNLYGTTVGGGVHHLSGCWYYGCGVVFKLTPSGRETVLYTFCAQNKHCPDGEYPYAGVVLDQTGNLYGTTLNGGVGEHCSNDYGCGVVFKLTPKGKETILYSFCAQSNCTDGHSPYAGLVFDK